MGFSRKSAFLLFALMVFIAWYWYHFRDDTVTLGNTSGNANGILVNAQGNSGVLSDKAFTSGTDQFDVGRLTTAADRNEVIAFTNSRPVAIKTPAMWTTGSDTVRPTFDNEIEISVTIWIVQSPFAIQSQRAADRCADVAAMWQSERMGVAFAPAGCDIRDATTGTRESFGACNNQSAFQARFGIVPNRINMYVVDTVKVLSTFGTGNGTTCGASDFAVLGSTVDAGVTIHELGHNFSLTHINSQTGIQPGFDANNIMHSASSTRQYFTEGQLFRAHFTPAVPLDQQPGSALNSVYVNVRTGQPTRDCASSVPCPVLEKRVWADGSLPSN